MAAASGHLSSRIQRNSSLPVLLRNFFVAVGKNPYNETENPQGIINLSTAQNSITGVADLLIEKLRQPELQAWDPSMLLYTERPGIFRLRKAIADFLSDETRSTAPLDPDKIRIVNGVTAGLSVVAFVVFEDGDTILSPCPMYGAIPRDFLFLSNVTTYPVHLSSKPGPNGREPFELTVQQLEETLEEAKQKGHKVKGLCLVNPNNPLGSVYTKTQVTEYLEFCKRHDLHCIIDEIYLASIYDESVANTSLLGFRPEEIPDAAKTHIIWGFSKDFGMPGVPVAGIYSWNQDVLDAIDSIIDFHQTPSSAQLATAKMIEDKEWLRTTYLPTNRKLLLESSQITMETLDEMGVPYVTPRAGLFIWLDLNKYLPENTFEEEQHLAYHLLDCGVAVPPAAGFYGNEHGWFRIVFTRPRKLLEEGLRRLKDGCASFALQNKKT